MLQSFRSRLVISNLLITLVGLLVIVFVFTRVLSDRSQSIKRGSLAEESRLVTSQVEYLFRHRNANFEAALQDLVNTASNTLKVRVIVAGRDGQPIYDSTGATPFFSGVYHPLDRKALQQERVVSQQIKSSSVRAFQTPLEGTRGHLIGAVILVASVSVVSPGLIELHDVFLVVLGTALLVWLAIGLFFTFSISRPLIRITAATEQMAEGRYDTRVPARGNGEIARLATSFNVMAQQVQQTNRVLKDFVANVSHDLRTPLTMITGFSQALLDGTAGPDKSDESAQVIHDEAVKMQHMVDDLLQLTRLESGLFAFSRKAVEVQPFVQSVIDRITRAHGTEQVATIENRVPARLPSIDVDREQIERALRNLLDNALQYTPARGHVRVTARLFGREWVEIGVADTGIGIPGQDVARIFERFYRSDKSRERVHGHSGLGLAIVREIVERHGGRIEVDSVPGKGSTFRFTVPRARAPEAEQEILPGRESVQPVRQ